MSDFSYLIQGHTYSLSDVIVYITGVVYDCDKQDLINQLRKASPGDWFKDVPNVGDIFVVKNKPVPSSFSLCKTCAPLAHKLNYENIISMTNEVEKEMTKLITKYCVNNTSPAYIAGERLSIDIEKYFLQFKNSYTEQYQKLTGE